MVGTSGSTAARFSVVTASALTRPARMCGMIGGMVLKLVMTCPATRSIAIGPPPLYGTGSRFVFVIILNISPAKCSGLPTPEVA